MPRDDPAVPVEMVEIVRRAQPDDGYPAADVEDAALRDRLAVPGQVEVVVPALGQLLEASYAQEHRPVAVAVFLAELEAADRVAVELRPVQVYGALRSDGRRRARRRMADQEADQRRARERHGAHERSALGWSPPPPRGRKRFLRPGHGLHSRRELRRRPRLDEELVRGAEPLALLRRNLLADELLEVGAAVHLSSPSSRSASRPRPARVRVFTVPSGMLRKSATSLCDSPP